jgi:hypothetical protein
MSTLVELLNDTGPDNLWIALLNDVKPERLIEFCVTEKQKQIILNTYKEKFVEGQQFVENLGFYLKDILKNFGMKKTWKNKNEILLNKIFTMLTDYPDTFSFDELDHHFLTQGLLLFDDKYDSLKELIEESLHIKLNDDNKTDDDLLKELITTKTIWGFPDGILFYNNSYTNNIKIYNAMTVHENGIHFNDKYIKIGKTYHEIVYYGGEDGRDESDMFAISHNKPRYYIRSMPNPKHRISNFIKLRKKLLTHINCLPHARDYNEYIKKIIRLLNRSIYGPFELVEWFDYAICEAIFGRLAKLYEIYIKN